MSAAECLSGVEPRVGCPELHWPTRQGSRINLEKEHSFVCEAALIGCMALSDFLFCLHMILMWLGVAHTHPHPACAELNGKPPIT